MSINASRTRTFIRDAECLVQQVDHNDTSNDELKPVTIFKSVRNGEAIFPVQKRETTKLVHPNKTPLVTDNSPGIQSSHKRPQIRHHHQNCPR